MGTKAALWPDHGEKSKKWKRENSREMWERKKRRKSRRRKRKKRWKRVRRKKGSRVMLSYW